MPVVAQLRPSRLLLRRMFITLLICVAAARVVEAAEPTRGVLHWHNGDQLPGVLQSADAETLFWQSELFENALQLELGVLDAIQYPTPDGAIKADLPFRVVTISNDVVLGDVVGIGDQFVEVVSPRHGRLQLKRSKLIGLQRHNRQAAGSVGLGLLHDWTTLHRGRRISEWSRGLDGRIETKVTGAELYRDLHLTSVSEIEVELQWIGKPGFMISFAGPDDVSLSKQVVKLETWENDLVLQTLGANGDFEVIMTIPPEKQSLEMRLQWNPGSGELSVYSATGQLLGKMKGEPLPAIQLSGLYIQNKGAQLDLVRLRANGWEGAGDELPEGAVRARLDDASTVTGRIIGFDRDTEQLQITSLAGQRQDIAVDRIDNLDLGNKPVPQQAAAPARITFLDGTQISGSLQSVEDGAVALKTAYSAQPVSADLNGVFAIRFAPPVEEREPRDADVIHFEQGRLRGELTAVSDQNHALGWRPVGGRNAGQLPKDQPLRISRAETSAEGVAKENKFLDRIFLRNGDAVPCNIHGIDETHLHVDVPLTDNSRIDRKMAVAIEFGSFSGAISQSFEDPQWVIGRGNDKAVTRAANEMAIRDTATIGYDNIRDADEISFQIKWNLMIPAYVRLALFTDGPQDTGNAPTIMFYRTSGNQIMVQALQVVGLGGMGQVRGVTPIETRDGISSFKLQLRRNHVTLFERDKELLQIPIDRNKLNGFSMSMSVQRLNMNNVRIANNNEDKPLLVAIQNPSIRRTGGDVLNVLVDESELERLLTIPRFRKQSPPTEVLVGQNGDLLRGRLVSLDDRQVTFVSRLEEITVPRERLSGIIWPQTEEAMKETERSDADLARILFADGSIVRMTADQLIDDAIVGQHPALGPIAVPVPLTREISMGGLVDTTHKNPFAAWMLRPAEEPQFAQTDQAGGDSGGAGNGFDSPMLGAAAPQFACDLLGDRRFQLVEQKGKIIVLDFWATWCGPCVKAMPHTMETVAGFPSDRVKLVAVNQLETPATIRKFLDARQWDVTVALDHDGQIGRLYQVDAIPHLVVIDEAGDVKYVFVGDRGDLANQLKQALEDLISKPAETQDGP